MKTNRDDNKNPRKDDNMRPKPDDRSDNVERIQNNIDHTIHNMELAEDMASRTDNPKTRQELQAKNGRRQDALSLMREEIRDEAIDREKGYQR